MLASIRDTPREARENKYAIGQFNINNLEWTKSMLLTAEELKSPIIPGVSEGVGKYMTGFKTVAAMVRAMMEELNVMVPVTLHPDHGTCDGCYKYIKTGFSSIMFDGPHYPIEESIEKTKELVKVVHAMSLSLEAGVGFIDDEEGGVVGLGECANPREYKAIVDLGADFLATGIGNTHGKYPENQPGLRSDVLEQIEAVVGDMSLVLHDGIDISEDMIEKTISLGVAKINVNTECQLSFTIVTKEYIEAGKDLKGKGFDPRKLLAPGAGVVRATVKERMGLLGSVGKA